MIEGDTVWSEFKSWLKLKPEEELFYRLEDDPIWPFIQVGEGHYQVCFRSDRVIFGIVVLICALFSFLLIILFLDYCEIAFAFWLVFSFFGAWAVYGQVGWRELDINTRKGEYTLRLYQNQRVLETNKLHNVYLRLARKLDSQNDAHFFLVIGGYGMDDVRVSRMTRAERALRIMGMRLAYRTGINFFDWKNVSDDHLVWHYRTHSRRIRRQRNKKRKKDKEHDEHEPVSTRTVPDIRITHQDEDVGVSPKALTKKLETVI